MLAQADELDELDGLMLTQFALTPDTAMDWRSTSIPLSIRRPWTVWENDLRDKLGDAASQGGDFSESLRLRVAMAQTHGVLTAFLQLPEDVQRSYAEVSLMELSAFVSWRRSQHAPRSSKKSLLRRWELLDCDDKAKWVPQGHRTELANDETWAPLLSDGPPLCGKAPEKEEPGEAKEETIAAPEKE